MLRLLENSRPHTESNPLPRAQYSLFAYCKCDRRATTRGYLETFCPPVFLRLSRSRFKTKLTINATTHTFLERSFRALQSGRKKAKFHSRQLPVEKNILFSY